MSKLEEAAINNNDFTFVNGSLTKKKTLCKELVIWTAEKTFVPHQKPHRKFNGNWATKNPHEIIECYNKVTLH